MKWTWDATGKKWNSASATTSAPPAHQGTTDGEEYEDTYSQSSDPTVTPFLHSSDLFMGHSGARKQLKKTKPSDTEIRVPAVKSKGLRGGSGLHEVVPTNLRDEVAASGNPVLIGLQSGFRTSTASQLFRRKATKGDTVPVGTDEVGAHTGFAPKSSGSGSTHTKGQGPAHDTLRKTSRKLVTETDPHVALNELALTHSETSPIGPEILASPYLTGMQPNIQSIGTLGPPSSSSAPPDPNRLKLAQTYHEQRETFKRRVRSLKTKYKRGRSPSPPRTPIDSSGKGGDPVTGLSSSYPLSPVPDFDGSPSSFEFTANMSSWVSAPQRQGFIPTPPIFPLATTSTSPPTPSLTAPPTTTLPSPPPSVPSLLPPPPSLLPPSVPSLLPSPPPILMPSTPSTPSLPATSTFPSLPITVSPSGRPMRKRRKPDRYT